MPTIVSKVMDFQLHALSLKLRTIKETYQNNVDVNVAAHKLDETTTKGIYTCFIFPTLLYYFSF
jgi:hypothetical protein